jgi:hypothetical protein
MKCLFIVQLEAESDEEHARHSRLAHEFWYGH